MTETDPTRARQGRKGSRVLIILIAGLALALIAFVGMGFFGASEPDENINGVGASGVSTEPATPPTSASPTVTPGTANTNTQ